MKYYHTLHGRAGKVRQDQRHHLHIAFLHGRAQEQRHLAPGPAPTETNMRKVTSDDDFRVPTFRVTVVEETRKERTRFLRS